MIKVVENFLPEKYLSKIVEKSSETNFPWFYDENPDPRFPNHKWNRILMHMIVYANNLNTPNAAFFMPIIYMIEREFNFDIVEIPGIRLMMSLSTPQNDEINFNRIDITNLDECYSATIYLHDVVGNMIIENSPKAEGEKLLISQFGEDKKLIPIKKNMIIITSNHYIQNDPFPNEEKHKTILNFIFQAKQIDNTI
jgi:hypothetical protein